MLATNGEERQVELDGFEEKRDENDDRLILATQILNILPSFSCGALYKGTS